MSLTSQISDRNSAVWNFFSTHESKDGMSRCLSQLQSRKPIILPENHILDVRTYTITGTAVDYLIRYACRNNKLIFERTVAYKTVEDVLRVSIFGDSNFFVSLNTLLIIGTRSLNGRSACTYKAAYGAIALSVIDNFYRSGLMPYGFWRAIFGQESPDRHFLYDYCFDSRNIQKKTLLWFQSYIETLGGNALAKDISSILRIFHHNRRSRNGDLLKSRFIKLNGTLANSSLVGGADFDCIIKSNGKNILTDIKTTIRPIQKKHLLQLIGYALLMNPRNDAFAITHVGVYHSRSGSFCYISLRELIKTALLNSWTVIYARREFIRHIKEY